MSGVNIVGVQFRRAGKIYDFDGKDFILKVGDSVVVDTERGPSLAEVKKLGFADETTRDLSVLKPVLRTASKKDIDDSGRLSSQEAESFTREKIDELSLDMRIINVEVQFGGNKVIVYFSAPGRVDFRELVKELASGLKTRVELKQVGARDEAKLTGGLGICGREFCCSSWLREFVPVSIKMAKNQNLALNPNKVSGGCGRLLCCLTYEDETYSELRQKLLPRGTRVELDDGETAKIIKGDILNQVFVVELPQGDQRTVGVNSVKPLNETKHEEQTSGQSSEAEMWAEDLDILALAEDSDKSKNKSQKKSSHRNNDRSDRKSQRNKSSSRDSKSSTDKKDGQSGRDNKKKRPPRNRGQRKSSEESKSNGDNSKGNNRNRRRHKNNNKKGDS